MLDRGLFRHKLAGPILQLLPDCADRLGFVQAVKMNAWGPSSQKIPRLLDSVSGTSLDCFFKIVRNRRKYLVHLLADVSTTSITEAK